MILLLCFTLIYTTGKAQVAGSKDNKSQEALAPKPPSKANALNVAGTPKPIVPGGEAKAPIETNTLPAGHVITVPKDKEAAAAQPKLPVNVVVPPAANTIKPNTAPPAVQTPVQK